MPGDTQTAHALASQQAARALDAELQARQAQQQRDAWIEAHPDLGIAYREVVRELAWRRRARAAAAEVDPPAHLIRALGPLPDSLRGQRAWRHAARLIEDYRDRYQIADPDQPLEPTPPRLTKQRQAWRAAHDALERISRRTFQRTSDRQGNVMTLPHGALLPWGELMAEGIPVLASDRVVTTLRSLPPLLDEIQIASLTEQVRRQLHPAD